MSIVDPAALLERAAFLAATAAGVTLVARRLPPIAGWVVRGLKPWACNLCCATWTTLGLAITLAAVERDAWVIGAWLPALALATWGLHQADPPPPPDLGLPLLEDPGEGGP